MNTGNTLLMLKIKINEQWIDVKLGLKIADIISTYKPQADVIIHNGFIADSNCEIKDGDIIILIKKGETPKKEELEHLMVARHTPKVHERLKSSSIAIAGLGGLGSNAAVSLARMGIGKLKLIDYDIVEPTNLNRQSYFISQIGMKKTEALKKIIADINPYVEVETADIFIDADNIYEIFKRYDVIIEAFDVAKTKAMFITKCATLFPDSYIIGASGVAGLFSTDIFKAINIGKNCTIIGDFENEAKEGVGLMATRVSVAANIQANLAVRHILGEGF